MDSFELNKVFCALLATVFVVMSLSILSEGLFHHEAPEQFGFEIAALEDGSATDTAVEGPAYDPVAPLLASADASAGQAVFKKCSSCHSIEEGGKNGTGPALYGIVERGIAGADGYSYSHALTTFADGGKTWTYEDLNGFLWKPKKYIKGTAMSFAGIKKVEDRANLIEYLRQQAATPAALPEG